MGLGLGGRGDRTSHSPCKDPQGPVSTIPSSSRCFRLRIASSVSPRLTTCKLGPGRGAHPASGSLCTLEMLCCPSTGWGIFLLMHLPGGSLASRPQSPWGCDLQSVRSTTVQGTSHRTSSRPNALSVCPRPCPPRMRFLENPAAISPGTPSTWPQ